jgi:hypothetical protein
MMLRTGIASISAVILPVSLGLGLIYLSATGQMEPMAALMVIVGIALLLPLAAMAARIAREDRLVRSDDGDGRSLIGD